jgi:hypothetical protein
MQLHRHHPPHIVSIKVIPTPPLRISDTAKRGTTVGRIVVVMSDGSRFNGTFHVTNPLFHVRRFFMSQLVLSRDLTAADDTQNGVCNVVATTADGKFTATLTITFTISPPVAAEGPPVFTGWPTAVALADNMTAGTLVASDMLTDSDGTPFNGTFAVNGGPFTFVA